MSDRNDYYQRLSKFLAYSGVASRRQSETLILSGKIKVNGVIVTSLTQKVSEKDIIFYNGKRILNNLKPRIWIYNKPAGELCSDFDPSGKKTVFDSIPKNEYEETLNKAKALFEAVKIANQQFND